MANVVVIDSGKEYIQDLIGMIKECKYNIQGVKDHEIAWKTIVQNRVHIVILEWEEDSTNAKALIEKIRSNHRTRRIHVIAISSCRTSEMLADALKATVEDFFSWPITLNEIRERLLWASNKQELLA